MEMFVVITIVGILISLIFTQYDRFKWRARDTNRWILVNQFRADIEAYARNPLNKNRYPIPTVLDRCMDTLISTDPLFREIRRGTGTHNQDPLRDKIRNISPCSQSGSLYYREIHHEDWAVSADGIVQDGVIIAARMEIPGNANIGTGAELESITPAGFDGFITDRMNTKWLVMEWASDYIYAIIIPNNK